MRNSLRISVNSSILHILAMVLMLCDHLWATLFPSAEWLTCLGRIAFPVFAFMTVEGYFHTHNLRLYILRLLVLAFLSEIPFNLMYSGSVFYPYHQNVIWTFLIGLSLIVLIEKCKKSFSKPIYLAITFAIVILGFVLGFLTMVDYYGVGVLTVLMFYFFHKRDWRNRTCQLLCMYIFNIEILGGYCYTVQLFGVSFEIAQQGLALLSLLPIWLYNGQKGINNKFFQCLCYAFYPVHMLVLFMIY